MEKKTHIESKNEEKVPVKKIEENNEINQDIKLKELEIETKIEKEREKENYENENEDHNNLENFPDILTNIHIELSSVTNENRKSKPVNMKR